MYFYPNEPKKRIIEQVAQVINAMTPAHGYDISVSEHKPKRTNAQNDFYWVNNDDVAKFLNDSGATMCFGLPYTSETIHEINKKYLGVPSTRKQDIHAFSEYMTKVFAFWIEKTNGMWQPKESPYGYLEKVGLVERG
jgi:hypothetical protein